jgi:hypothetical protein
MTMPIHSSTTPGVRFVPPYTAPAAPARVPPEQYYPAPAPVPSPIPVIDSNTFSCSKWRAGLYHERAHLGFLDGLNDPHPTVAPLHPLVPQADPHLLANRGPGTPYWGVPPAAYGGPYGMGPGGSRLPNKARIHTSPTMLLCAIQRYCAVILDSHRQLFTYPDIGYPTSGWAALVAATSHHRWHDPFWKYHDIMLA